MAESQIITYSITRESIKEKMALRRKRAAKASIISNSCLIISKLGVGLAIGSISVISEAIHSSVDLLAAIIAFVAIRIAARPADKSHPYGHGKFENLSGTVESLLIFVGAGIIISEAIQKFSAHTETDTAIWGVAVMALSAGVNIVVSRYLYKVSRETDSIALKADAAHLHTDVMTSIGVLVGLALVWLTGWSWLDPLTALLVALLIIKAGWDILYHSVEGLLDASLPVVEETAIALILDTHKERFINYHELRTRQSGPDRHIDFHLVVKDEMTTHDAHLLCDELEASIHTSINGAVVQIHIEPQSICNYVDGKYHCSSSFEQPIIEVLVPVSRYALHFIRVNFGYTQI